MKTNAPYQTLKVNELKGLLRKKKIKFTGKEKKADLIKLLNKYDKQREHLTDIDEKQKSNTSVLMGDKKINTDNNKNEKFFDAEEIIPERYNETKIVLLVKDPHWVFAYWETSDNDMEKLKNIDAYKWVLRVYNENEESFDIVVTDTAVNWYINVPESGRSYYVDLGIVDKKGDFILVATSNKITTPPGKISDIIDEEWMIVEEEFEELYKMIANGNVGGSSEVLLKKFLNKLEKELSSVHLSSWSSSKHAD